MKEKFNKFLNNFKTITNSTFIKRQILNCALFNLLSLTALICGLVLTILGFVRDYNVYLVFGLIFIIVFFILISLSWSLFFLLKQNSFFVQRLFKKKINFLLIFFWKGLQFVDDLTEYEIQHNYDFDYSVKKENQIKSPVKTIKSEDKKNSNNIQITELIKSTEVSQALAQSNSKTNQKNEIVVNNDDLTFKLEQYKELLNRQKELQVKLDQIKEVKNLNAEEQIENLILIEKIETEIIQKTIKIEETEKEVDYLISDYDLSSRSKMLNKKDELEKLLIFYQEQKKLKTKQN